MNSLIQILETAREDQDKSYDKVSLEVGITASNVHRILKGKSDPKWSNLKKITKCLSGLDLEKLIIENLQASKTIKKASKKIIEPNTNFWPEETIKELMKDDKKAKPKKQEKEKCPDCKYGQTQSGLSIRILKCDNCKKLKK